MGWFKIPNFKEDWFKIPKLPLCHPYNLRCTFFTVITEYNPDDATLRCKNGQSYTLSDVCLYDHDEYGILQGCRDATHLEHCGNYYIDKIFPKVF